MNGVIRIKSKGTDYSPQNLNLFILTSLKSDVVDIFQTNYIARSEFEITKDYMDCKQGCNVRKVNCGCVYSAYILKPVLSGRNL